MESLSQEEFKTSMVKLEHAFNTTLKKEALKVYWEYLAPHFTNNNFKTTVEKIILKERFFPSISVFMDNKVLTYWEAKKKKALEDREY